MSPNPDEQIKPTNKTPTSQTTARIRAFATTVYLTALRDEQDVTDGNQCTAASENDSGSPVHAGHTDATRHGATKTRNENSTAKVSDQRDTPDVAIADGGLVVRDLETIQSDKLVRKYSPLPGILLYAYRSEEGEHHIVVSRGDEPKARWEKRTPATVERPLPGQTRWTIPDNWDRLGATKSDTYAEALYYVPDSDIWAQVYVPTHDHLTDATYRVEKVGDLNIEPVGQLGSKYDVRQVANEYEQYEHETAEEGAEAIREIAANWDTIEEDLRLTLQWVREEGLDELRPGNREVPVGQNWTIEFNHDRVFDPGVALKQTMDFSEYSTPKSVLLDELRNADLLPDHYRFKLTLDESLELGYYVRALIEAGVSPADAVDYAMVEVNGLTPAEWADERDIDHSAVRENVNRTRRRFE